MEIDENQPESEKAERIKFRIPKFAISHSKEIVSAVIVGVLVTLISTAIMNGYFYPDDDQPEYQLAGQYQHTTNSIDPSNRSYFVRASLAQAISAITPVKIALSEYYMSTGELPTEGSDFDISIFDLNEHETIENAHITNEGRIGVNLSSTFGKSKSLTIQPEASKNGTFLKWHCSTNIDEQYLGFGNSKICGYNDSL